MPRPAKRARAEEDRQVYEHVEEDDDVHEDDMDGDDDDDDMGDGDEHGDERDADADADTDGDREAHALVSALANADHNEESQPQPQPQQEHIIDYCYRKGYFPANERFPNAVTANRFRAAPLRPQRTLEKNPFTRRSWHPKQPANWCAVLLQCGGQEVSEACTRCQEGQGFWTQCVVPNDWATSWITRGACANCYMDGKRGMCSRGFGMVVSPTARAKVAAAAAAAAPQPGTQPATSSPAVTTSSAPTSTPAAPFTSAGFAPPAEAPRKRGRPPGPTASNRVNNSLSNQDFESLKRQYNRMSTVELDKLAEQLANERARISLQLAAIDAVRAARETFANSQPNGGPQAA